MKTKTKILSNEYEDNKRLSTQIVTYTKADDLQMLADIQRRIENIEDEIELSGDAVTKTRLSAMIDELKAEFAEQQSYVDGYLEDAV